MTNVFIAPKIKVGFQKRSDTFTGQLAYIIYYDDKGKIRKEKSWESWRDKAIDPQEFDNKPMSGFTLNKDVKRYSGDWFSSHRTMIRVHDPRGFEFEVTTENLIGILMHTDCLRRGLIGEFVYAWVGPELVLLPTNSEEYQNATKFTAGLSKKVKAKDLVPGISYKTKREGDVVFMGKLTWYEYLPKKGGGRYSNRRGLRQEAKGLVFTNDDGKSFFRKPSVDFLSEANNDTPVSNFAELMTKFNAKSYANKVVRYEFRPVSFDPELVQQEHWGPRLRRVSYFVESDIRGVFYDCSVNAQAKRLPDQNGGWSDKYSIEGYEYPGNYYGANVTGIKQADGELLDVTSPNYTNQDYFCNRRSPYNLAHMQAQRFYDLYVVFESGEARQIDSTYKLTGEDY